MANWWILTLTPVRTEIADNFGNKMEVGPHRRGDQQ